MKKETQKIFDEMNDIEPEVKRVQPKVSSHLFHDARDDALFLHGLHDAYYGKRKKCQARKTEEKKQREFSELFE